MENKSIVVNGEAVYFCNKMEVTKLFHDQRKRRNHSNGKGNLMDICPFCKKRIKEGDEIYIVINNYKLFPNIFGHVGCVEVSEEELIKKCEGFVEEYAKYLELKSIWG